MELADKAEYVRCLWFKLDETTPLPIMYWISSLYKKPGGASFITASKACFTKQLPKFDSKLLLTERLKLFHKNTKYLSN